MCKILQKRFECTCEIKRLQFIRTVRAFDIEVGKTVEQPKLWSRNLIVLMGVNFCSALSFYLTMVKITQFAVDTYGVDMSTASLTITAYVIAALFTRMFFGAKIDTWGARRAMAIGSAVNAAAMVLYLVPMGFVPLMVIRVLHGFGFAIMSGSAAATAALVIPPERYGEGIGYFSMMQALATGIGPFVAIVLTDVFGGYTPMFAFAAVAAGIALASVSLLKVPPRTHMAKHVSALQDIREKGIGAFVQLSVVPLASVLFLVYIGYSGILSFVASYAAESGLNDAVSLYFVVYAVVIFVSRPPVGRRVDRKGENSTIYFCLVSLVVGFVVLAFAINGVLLLVSAALAGFGIGATQSIVQAVIVRDAPADAQGKANSTFFMSMDLGSGIGPVIIGSVIPIIGYRASYLALAFIAIVRHKAAT